MNFDHSRSGRQLRQCVLRIILLYLLSLHYPGRTVPVWRTSAVMVLVGMARTPARPTTDHATT